MKISETIKGLADDLGIKLEFSAHYGKTGLDGGLYLYRATKRFAVNGDDYEYASHYAEDTEHERLMFIIEAHGAFSRALHKLLGETSYVDISAVKH